jgi:magnesium transporter
VKARKKKKLPNYTQIILESLEGGDTARVRSVLGQLHPADIGKLLESIPPQQRHAVWALTEPGKDGEVLLEVSEDVRRDLIREMDGAELVAAARALDIDDIADLIPDLSDEVIAEILFALGKQDRQRLDAVLSYADDTAGGLMNVDTVTVRENISQEVVLRYLRSRGALPEHTVNLFVVDRADHLLGVLPLTRLLTTDTSLRVSQVMDRDVTKFAATTPDRDVAAAFERYNLVAAPVVDEQNRLIGRITIDDVVDVLRERADESIMGMGGLHKEEDLFAPVLRKARNRWPWILLNLVTAFVASSVIGAYQETIHVLVVLAALMPIVAAIAGNTGNQTVALIVRALALGEVNYASLGRLLLRELAVSAVNGALWGLIAGVVVWVIYRDLRLASVLAVAMLLNLLVAAAMGVLIPLVLRRMGRDPALGSTVLLTATTDSMGFLIFLSLATFVLV